MKTWSLLALLVLALPARGQVDLLHAERLGSLYLSAQPDAYVDRLALNVPSWSTFEFYLVVEVDFADIGEESQNAFNGLQAWEVQVSLPAEFLIRSTLSPNTSIDVGLQHGNVLDFLVGTGSLVPAGGPQVLVSFEVLYRDRVTDDYARLGPNTGPSVPGEAVWVESIPSNGCSLNGMAESCQFRFASLGDLHFDAGLPSEVQSFGAIKARF